MNQVKIVYGSIFNDPGSGYVKEIMFHLMTLIDIIMHLIPMNAGSCCQMDGSMENLRWYEIKESVNRYWMRIQIIKEFRLKVYLTKSLQLIPFEMQGLIPMISAPRNCNKIWEAQYVTFILRIAIFMDSETLLPDNVRDLIFGFCGAPRVVNI